MREADADVVVVGCGPVGVMAALRCAQRGLSVIAIDRSTEVYPLPRAIGMDDEVQDLFWRAGLGDELAQCSTPMLGGEFVDAAGTRVVGVDVPPGTVGALGHPPMVAFDQPSLERFLRAAAIDHGVDLRLGVEAATVNQVNLEPGGRGTEVTTADQRTITARWLIGADGAKSTIRDLVNITLVDQEFDQTWLVVDTTLLDSDLALPTIPRQHCDPARVVTFVPGHDRRRRWEFQLKPGETRDDALAPGFLGSMLEPWGTPEQLRVDRSAVYRFHATVADRFRAGSVFLAGDAAHQMPPFNGQGMCSGMRDVENLAWKLSHVATGHASDALLDTYDAERRPHATSQVAHSVDAGLLIEAIAHDGEAALGSGYGRRRFPKLAHGLVEGDHRLVGMPLPRPMSGTVSVENGWTIVGTATDPQPEIPALWKQLDASVQVVAPEAYDITSDELILVRPDRFVAAVTNDLTNTTTRFGALFRDAALGSQ